MGDEESRNAREGLKRRPGETAKEGGGKGEEQEGRWKTERYGMSSRLLRVLQRENNGNGAGEGKGGEKGVGGRGKKLDGARGAHVLIPMAILGEDS